ncbi:MULTISPECIES: aldehyde dehydrogenase [Paenibacillus]|uniref:aldehyde dehydrogenase n=1 Tax=Paenibacillus TaxID=44249 RepID=UPI0008876620|nr:MULTISPECIES: aldehyde dehydrogenase [Paenibacillus]NTZ20107.1 aldehyde dehydrogenase [Paenibacillus sp. JMULE4]GCL73293.1 carnitine dehydratase [Paenibacillus naphthalenovorans]SDI33386.1 aldehyde dehydrogenase (NAD+) [Paenibacillus naphthalenovorans]
MEQYQLYIGGQWVEAQSGERSESINPYTNEAWASVPVGAEADIDLAVQAARRAFDEGPWSKMSNSERGRLLIRLAHLIENNIERLAQIETRDNGKLIRETTAHLKSLVDYYIYFGGMADKIHGDVIPLNKTSVLNYTLREPIGVVGAITPWNSPLLLTTWKAAPALAAGNVMVIKPSSTTPCSILEFAKLVEEAGFPPGVFNVVTGPGSRIGNYLVQHPGVDKISFTGGTDTGRSLASLAGKHIKRITLELGGKSPNIVFEDANLDNAVMGVMAGIYAACGQTCSAGSRLLLQRSIYDEFLNKLAERSRQIKLGDPSDWHTEVGPLANRSQLEKVAYYVDIAKQEGAEVLLGGKRPEAAELQQGLFYEPTILTNVTNDMRVAREEIFGPVLSVIPFETEDEAIRIANDSDFGLVAGVWTNHISRGHRMARAIRSGTVWVNTFRNANYASPFGGYKASGYGRENGLEVLKDYTQVKSVWVETEEKMRDPFVVG